MKQALRSIFTKTLRRTSFPQLEPPTPPVQSDITATLGDNLFLNNLICPKCHQGNMHLSGVYWDNPNNPQKFTSFFTCEWTELCGAKMFIESSVLSARLSSPCPTTTNEKKEDNERFSFRRK